MLYFSIFKFVTVKIQGKYTRYSIFLWKLQWICYPMAVFRTLNDPYLTVTKSSKIARE